MTEYVSGRTIEKNQTGRAPVHEKDHGTICMVNKKK